MMKDNILITEKIPHLFVRFVLPSVISMILVGIQGMVDGIFLGNYESSNAMASVNIANPFMQCILGTSFIICTGALSYIGRTLGEKNRKKAQDIFKTAVISIFVCSCTIMFIGFLFHDGIAWFLGANEVLSGGTSRYIMIVSLFAPIISFMLLFGFMQRLIEKPRLYLIAAICCLAGNITMNYMFIKILKLGITGVALATGLSYFIGLLVVIFPYFQKETMVNVYDGKFNWKFLWTLVCNGSSEGVNYLATALIVFLFNKELMGFAGENGIAAFTIINYIGNFTTILMFGVSDGIGSIISCNYGAEKLKRVKVTLHAAIALNFLLGVGVFLILNLFSKNLVYMFINNDSLITEMAAYGAKIYATSFLFSGYNIIQSGYHTSLGNALASALIAASRGIFFVVVGFLLLPYIWGINGVWFTLSFAEIMTIVCCLSIRIFMNKKIEK